ncbi:MAG: hypothetical protein IT383_20840 [Deltaproteobacteria bacterium]|nr:hypothetical protein [Deltaproteobacteria bacterium]
MKLRIGVGAALFAIGLALAGLAVAQRGAPWGFRGHAAALSEATHNVELVPSSARAERDGLGDALLPRTPGTFLDVGDGVRVGVHSEARVVLPGGGLVFGDGTRAVLTAKGVRLEQGLLDVTVTAGAAPVEVEVGAPAAKLTLHAAEVDGAFRVLADGKHELRALVRAGSMDASTGVAAQTVTEGKLLSVGADGAPKLGEPPASLAISATCADRRVTVQAPPATQLYVDGALHYPEAGMLSVTTVDAHPQRTHVLGRDVTGNVAPVVEVACAAPPKPPAPPPPTPKPPSPLPAPAP